MASPSQTEGQGQPQTPWGEYNRIAFAITQALAKIQTVMVVQVVKCSNTGGLAPVGTVDVLPLVNQIDAKGNPIPHVTIYNVPYFRLQGGNTAVILDPVVGDIGVCTFASRDISKVKATKKQSNPGSRRRFSFSDGLYFGGFLNGNPTQYVQCNSSGITLHSPNAITLDAPTITLHGAVQQTGGADCTFSAKITATGDVIGQGTSLHTHDHVIPGTQSDGAPFPNTGAPV